MTERKYQTMQEIERQYDGNWVIMANCKENERYKIIGGEVVAASKDRETIVKLLGQKLGGLVYTCFVGSIPGETGGYLL
jgi:hypothetical protein